jgi:hypothetical protein
MGINTLKQFLVAKRLDDKEKERILRRILDSNVRMMGLAYRQSHQWTHNEIESERSFLNKQRGIMRRMISNTTRLMGMGFNKLLSESKARETLLQQKLTFVIKSLTDKDTLYTLCAYNGIKEQYHKAIKANLVQNDSSLKLLNDRKFSDRILRRLMDSTFSLQGQAYVSLLNHLSSQTSSQNQLTYRQRAIFRRIIDANSRLASIGFNKLIESSKARQNHTSEKLRFVVKSLKNQESMFLLQAWNGLKERRGLLAGVGAGMGQVNKLKIIRRLMNKAFDWECQAWGKLVGNRDLSMGKAEQTDRDKDSFLRRIMDGSARSVGQALRMFRVHAKMEWEKEKALVKKKRRILGRLADVNVRLMSAG